MGRFLKPRTEQRESFAVKLQKRHKDTFERLSTDISMTKSELLEAWIEMLDEPTNSNLKEWQNRHKEVYPEKYVKSKPKINQTTTDTATKTITEANTKKKLTLDKCLSHKDLLQHAKSIGKSVGWAYHQANERGFEIFGNQDEQQAYFDAIN